jgi:hypothetical protein
MHDKSQHLLLFKMCSQSFIIHARRFATPPLVCNVLSVIHSPCTTNCNTSSCLKCAQSFIVHASEQVIKGPALYITHKPDQTLSAKSTSMFIPIASTMRFQCRERQLVNQSVTCALQRQGHGIQGMIRNKNLKAAHVCLVLQMG